MALIAPLVIEQTEKPFEDAYFKVVNPSLQEGSERAVRFNLEVYISKADRFAGRPPMRVDVGLTFSYNMNTVQNIYQDCYEFLKSELGGFSGAVDDR